MKSLSKARVIQVAKFPAFYFLERGLKGGEKLWKCCWETIRFSNEGLCLRKQKIRFIKLDRRRLIIEWSYQESINLLGSFIAWFCNFTAEIFMVAIYNFWIFSCLHKWESKLMKTIKLRFKQLWNLVAISYLEKFEND